MSEHMDDLDLQLALEGRLNGWQVYRARVRRWARGVEVPAGHYWACHWYPDEPAAVAADLDTLEAEIGKRTPPLTPRECPSVMRALLTAAEAEELEVADGVWFLPGPPP